MRAYVKPVFVKRVCLSAVTAQVATSGDPVKT